MVDSLFIRIEFFRYLLRLRRYKRKSVEVGVFRRVDHFERKFQTEWDITHQSLLVLENYSDCPFVLYQNIQGALFGFVTKHACDRQTDHGRTNKQNYDSQDRTSIAASRGKKLLNMRNWKNTCS